MPQTLKEDLSKKVLLEEDIRNYLQRSTSWWLNIAVPIGGVIMAVIFAWATFGKDIAILQTKQEEAAKRIESIEGTVNKLDDKLDRILDKQRR